MIVLETEAARASITQILQDHSIPSERSPDLVPVVEIAPAPNATSSLDSVSPLESVAQQRTVSSEDLQIGRDQGQAVFIPPEKII